MEMNKLREEFLKKEKTSFSGIPINGVYWSYILWLEEKIKLKSKPKIKKLK
jgi:hypothetical protein